MKSHLKISTHIRPVFALITAMILVAAGSAGATPAAFASGTIISTSPVPAGAPQSSDFAVSAGGSAVGVYDAGANAWANQVSFGQFDFSGGPVTVSVVVNFPFTSYRLAPNSLLLASSKSANVITFSLASPTNVTVVLDGNYQGRVLHLFAQAPDTTPVTASGPGVTYFAPGFHDLSTQPPLIIASGQSVYLAQGAVVRGRILIKNATTAAVRGHGLIVDDYTSHDAYDNVALAIKNSSNVTIDGIMMNRRAPSWTAFMVGSNTVAVTGIHVVSPTYASSDGFDIVSSHDVTFDSVFIRSCDDAVSIKGYPNGDYNAVANPGAYPAVYNIMYKNSQLWADANNAMVVGEETIASSYSQIHFSNIDVLYNFDDVAHPDILTDRAAIEVLSLNATPMSAITFDYIRVDQAKRLINVAITNNFYLNSLNGNQGWPGGISGVTFSNITSTSTGNNQIRLNGWDASHTVSNTSLSNVVINGAPVTGFGDTHLNINSLVSNTQITSGGATITNPAQPINMSPGTDWSPYVYDLSHDLTPQQNNQGWSFQTWKSSVGFTPMTWNASLQRWVGQATYDQVWNGTGRVFVSPDNDQVLLNWTAPHAGKINVTGTIAKFDAAGGDGISVSIWQNATQVWPASGGWQNVAYNNTVGYSPSQTLTIAPGDVISFRVDQNSTPANDTASWSPRITYILPKTYDLSDDFGSAQGMEGWTFQTWKSGVGYSPMTWNPSTGRWVGTATYDQLWNGTRQVFLSPDNDQILLNWTAPQAGTVNVTGTVAKFDATGGDGISVSIWKNATQVWPAPGAWQNVAYNNTVGYSPSQMLTVAAGDAISFRVDQNSTPTNDTASWSPRITYQ
jgi:hypothetical protein